MAVWQGMQWSQVHYLLKVRKRPCNAKQVIYKISSRCGETYVGETRRPLKEQFREHLAHGNHSNVRQMSWAKYICQKRANKAILWQRRFFEVERDAQNRKIKETQSQRPDVNMRNKMVGSMHYIVTILWYYVENSIILRCRMLPTSVMKYVAKQYYWDTCFSSQLLFILQPTSRIKVVFPPLLTSFFFFLFFLATDGALRRNVFYCFLKT